MAYSTIAEIRANEYQLQLSVSADLTDAVITNRIAFADKHVEADLGGVVTFPLVGTTPAYIALLSQYKATELCLVWLYTRKREGLVNDDIEYWRKLYDDLVAKILAGDIALGSSATGTATFAQKSKAGIEPALGLKDYGNFANESDLIDDRPTR